VEITERLPAPGGSATALCSEKHTNTWRIRIAC